MMAGMKRIVNDPDEYSSMIQSGGLLTITGHGRFEATLSQIELNDLLLHSVSETLARVWESDRQLGRTAVVFSAEATAEHFVNGQFVGPNMISLHLPGQPICSRTTGASNWGSLSLTTEAWEKNYVAFHDHSAPSCTSTSIATPSYNPLDQMRRLHSAAVRISDSAPEVFNNTEAARGLEQELCRAMVECTRIPKPRVTSGINWRRYGQIIKKFKDTIEAEGDRATYLPELCAAIGVSDRMLRKCCHEYYGVGPKRYLFLRRMHLAHQALRRCKGTVTEIATEFGFWELGRFSVQYKLMFGESPSATLRSSSHISSADGKGQGN